MIERVHRLLAVVRADVLVRMRRPSTAILFVLLSIIPYMWIPAPSTGRALISIGGRRALYDSAAIGMATAMLGTLFLGLAGFYIVSNTLRRDVTSRCGFVIASTTMRGSEYIVGKFAGNVAFLTLFTLGYMAAAMAMLLVRGEAALEPLVFAKQYLVLMPPSIVFVSAISIAFECTPLLRTKLGDVAYFILWIMLLAAAGSMVEGNSSRWSSSLDVTGLGVVMQQIEAGPGGKSVSIGASTFDASKPPVVFRGLELGTKWLGPRIAAMLWPLLLLVVARLFFHRFDPARVRSMPNERSRRSWGGRLNAMSKPVARLVVRIGEAVASLPLLPSFVRAALTDATATLAAFPLVVVAIGGFAVAAAASDAQSLFSGLLPIAYAACGIAIADVASREKRSGTTALAFAVPGLRTKLVAWKFASSLVVALVFLAVPLARAIAFRPETAVPLLAGVAFIAATATSLGIVSSNPKTFLVLFLTFCYVVMNDQGASPAMDYAGFFGATTPAVTAGYGLAAIGALVAAQLYHLSELRRRW
jgi:hypothetical protein